MTTNALTVDLLRHSVEEWNAYRRDNPDVYPVLTGADLRGADLRGADLRGADLTDADLTDADLTDADLRGATLNWTSHELVAEALRQAAGDDPRKLMLAGLPHVTRDKCWRDYAAMDIPADLRAWAIATLRSYIQPDDHHPALLDEEAQS